MSTYRYRFRQDLNLLDIAWQGLFTPDLVRTYAQELGQRFKREGFRPGYRLRMDMSESATQPQSTVPAFVEGFRDFPKAERIAIVTPSMLMRMQVEAVMTQPYLRVFRTADESVDWLLGSEVQLN